MPTPIDDADAFSYIFDDGDTLTESDVCERCGHPREQHLEDGGGECPDHKGTFQEPRP